MKAATKYIPTTQRDRKVCMLEWCQATGIGCVRVTETSARKVKEDRYILTEMTCELEGRAFQVEKIGDETARYAVRISAGDCSCECMGHLRHGHCRHVEFLTALVERKVI